MSNTCATHRSRVPQRSSEKIKGGVPIANDERGQGLGHFSCGFVYVYEGSP